MQTQRKAMVERIGHSRTLTPVSILKIGYFPLSIIYQASLLHFNGRKAIAI